MIWLSIVGDIKVLVLVPNGKKQSLKDQKRIELGLKVGGVRIGREWH